jgi:hypothetical protein
MKAFRREPGVSATRSARQDVPVVLAFVAAGAVLAATSALGMAGASSAGASAMEGNATSPSGAAGLSTVLNGITKSSNETFSVTYHIVNPTSKQDMSITFAQSPGKEAVITSKGSFYITSSGVTICTGTGDKTCTKLPTALMGLSLASIDALKELFAPGVIANNLKGIEGIVAAHPSGVSASTSSQTFDHLGSTCIHLSGHKFSAPVTYCAANSSGVLDHAQSGGNSITMTAFSQHPGTSTFSPPAGAKIVSVSKLP